MRKTGPMFSLWLLLLFSLVFPAGCGPAEEANHGEILFQYDDAEWLLADGAFYNGKPRREEAMQLTPVGFTVKTGLVDDALYGGRAKATGLARSGGYSSLNLQNFDVSKTTALYWRKGQGHALSYGAYDSLLPGITPTSCGVPAFSDLGKDGRLCGGKGYCASPFTIMEFNPRKSCYRF